MSLVGKDVAVTLDWQECFWVALVGVKRQLEAIRKGLKDQHGYNGDGWSHHINGAGGEAAYAKAAGVWWNPSVNTFKVPDCDGLHIRTRSGGVREDLIIRPTDPEGIYVLVVGTLPSFVISGWITSQDARRDDWIRDYGSRPEAWFVPRAALSHFPVPDSI